MTAQPAKEIRPPLPQGPFLVVGLARSGQAAARLLAARGETVRAVDSGHPDGAERLREAGVEVVLDTDGLAQLEGTRTVVKSPGVPREAPVIATALERGAEVVGELELAWRALPNRFIAVTGTNGKTTTVELLAHIYRRARHAGAAAGQGGSRRGQRSARRSRRWSARSRPTPPSSASAPASSSRTPAASPRSVRSSSTSPPITSTATVTSPPTGRRSCGSSPTRATTTSPSTTPTIPSSPGSTSAAVRGGAAFVLGPAPTARSR